VGVQDTTNCN